MAAAATAYGFSPATCSIRPHNRSLLSPPSAFIALNNSFKFPRLRIKHIRTAQKVQACEDAEFASIPSDSVSIDIKLPRRSLMVHFTCNSCGERTQRLVNRLAYERGTVFVQCAGCLQHHKLVDNLGLVVEYDFREDINLDSNKAQE